VRNSLAKRISSFRNVLASELARFSQRMRRKRFHTQCRFQPRGMDFGFRTALTIYLLILAMNSGYSASENGQAPISVWYKNTRRFYPERLSRGGAFFAPFILIQVRSFFSHSSASRQYIYLARASSLFWYRESRLHLRNRPQSLFFVLKLWNSSSEQPK